MILYENDSNWSLKSLDRKILQNEAQYDLDRKAGKISALPYNYLDKYEYVTVEDLGLKPSTVEQAKREYSLLGKVFNKGMDKEEHKKEGLLKRLKNFEDKNKEQLVKNKGENIKEVTCQKTLKFGSKSVNWRN